MEIKAFISYSSKDKKYGGWVARALWNFEFMGAPSFGVGRAGLLSGYPAQFHRGTQGQPRVAVLHDKLTDLILVRKFHRRRKDGLGPLWCHGQIARIHDLAAVHVKQQSWLRSDAPSRITLLTVVIDPKLREFRH